MSKSNTPDNHDDLLIKVQENWDKVKSLVNRIEDEKVKAGLNSLTDHLYDRMAVAPASTRKEYNGCFVGGLVWHSLNVLRTMNSLRTSLDLGDEVSADSMILLGLFHDIGKLGNEDNDYYVPQNSEWHREKLGQLYEVNKGMGNVPVPVRTLWWLNKFNIPLSENEIHAIQSLKFNNEEVSFIPGASETWEPYLLQSAIRGACIKYRNVAGL